MAKRRRFDFSWHQKMMALLYQMITIEIWYKKVVNLKRLLANVYLCIHSLTTVLCHPMIRSADLDQLWKISCVYNQSMCDRFMFSLRIFHSKHVFVLSACAERVIHHHLVHMVKNVHTVTSANFIIRNVVADHTNRSPNVCPNMLPAICLPEIRIAKIRQLFKVNR